MEIRRLRLQVICGIITAALGLAAFTAIGLVWVWALLANPPIITAETDPIVFLLAAFASLLAAAYAGGCSHHAYERAHEALDALDKAQSYTARHGGSATRTRTSEGFRCR